MERADPCNHRGPPGRSAALWRKDTSIAVEARTSRGLWLFGLLLLVTPPWTAFVGQLAVARHMNLQTNAFDLGYVSQALWYDAHGEPFRFTTIQGVNAVVEGVDLGRIKHPHWLLAFHVEPA